jgi:hypothetical protein
MDYRLSNNGQFYLLEANPNPQIARNEDFADSAAHCGLTYCPSPEDPHPGTSYSETFGQNPHGDLSHSHDISLPRMTRITRATQSQRQATELHYPCHAMAGGRRSTNVEDRRGMRVGPMAIGGGLGTIVHCGDRTSPWSESGDLINTGSYDTVAPTETAPANDETTDL